MVSMAAVHLIFKSPDLEKILSRTLSLKAEKNSISLTFFLGIHTSVQELMFQGPLFHLLSDTELAYLVWQARYLDTTCKNKITVLMK